MMFRCVHIGRRHSSALEVFRCYLPSSSSRYANEKKGSASNVRKAAHVWNYRSSGIQLPVVRQDNRLQTTTIQPAASSFWTSFDLTRRSGVTYFYLHAFFPPSVLPLQIRVCPFRRPFFDFGCCVRPWKNSSAPLTARNLLRTFRAPCLPTAPPSWSAASAERVVGPAVAGKN